MVLVPLDQLHYLRLITGYFVPRPEPSSLVPDPCPSSRTIVPRPGPSSLVRDRRPSSWTVVPRPRPSSLVPDRRPSPFDPFWHIYSRVRFALWTQNLLYACRPYVYLFITIVMSCLVMSKPNVRVRLGLRIFFVLREGGHSRRPVI